MSRRERGFTLIELMVALVVSSLLVGMILAIFSRMSLAYRGQQQIAGVQQVLAAARATIEIDAKQAGLEMPQGFKFAVDGTNPLPRSPVKVIDSSTGPDILHFYYADPSIQAKVTAGGAWSATPSIVVDSTEGFADDDLVVLSTVTTSLSATTLDMPGADIAAYDACVLKISSVSSANTLEFVTAAPWGRADTGHCTPATNQTMVYKLVARAYRIDTSTPERAALGPLQQSRTGALTNSADDNWTDLAYGFTDIQSALRMYEPDDLLDRDGDNDQLRDWYSDGVQNVKTGNLTPTSLFAPIQMSISLVARTDRDVEGIATSETPDLIVAASPGNNSLGNHALVTLPSATDPALQGAKIYRYTTFQVDLRNLGVGR
jgi:prepilin-type N-terminal cleavage/methylation domain-containing protein